MSRLRIVYDHQPDEVVGKVNEALAKLNLEFVDDGKRHDGFCLYELRRTDGLPLVPPVAVPSEMIPEGVEQLKAELVRVSQIAAERVGGDPRVRDLLLYWFGTTDPDILQDQFKGEPNCRLQAEVVRLQRLTEGLAERVAGQSDRLTYLAQRSYPLPPLYRHALDDEGLTAFRPLDAVTANAVEEVAALCERGAF